MLLVQQISKSEVLLGVYFIVVIVVLVVLFILFFYTFQKRKNQLLISQAVREQEFEKALAESEHEIKEETLKNIGMELHDNVGQLLSVAKMQINMGLGTLEEAQKEPFEDARDTVGKSLTEIRSLSKVINGEVMAQWRLYDAIEEEVKRLNKSGVISVTYTILGVVFPILQKEKIIIFRIIQECCSNVVKHANATELEIVVQYSDNRIQISIRDNGVGFDVRQAVKGSGLINMQSRAKLIAADLTFDSIVRKGTTITLIYSPNNETM